MQTPPLDQITALAPRQCGSGYVTFEIAAGSTPDGVQYNGVPNHTYQWGP